MKKTTFFGLFILLTLNCCVLTYAQSDEFIFLKEMLISGSLYNSEKVSENVPLISDTFLIYSPSRQLLSVEFLKPIKSPNGKPIFCRIEDGIEKLLGYGFKLGVEPSIR